jgi:colanic acid/amylovoran biosynthesis glycosyltransferase
MRSVAYLSNQFPEAHEAYVFDEINELRKCGCKVIPCSIRRPVEIPSETAPLETETLYAFPLQWKASLKATLVLLVHFRQIAGLFWRIIRGPEPAALRLRALAHTWLGAYMAVLLKKKRIRHIHIHHGYFSAWVGMVASTLLGASFRTLHGSDLLVRADYLDCKLQNCRFCVTVSEFNRDYILERYPTVDPRKVLVHHLGIDTQFWTPLGQPSSRKSFSILSVGRLHPVKNYSFLILACHALKSQGMQFRCVIAGEGEEHQKLAELIHTLGLEHDVTLLGHVPRAKLPALYAAADVVVLTSRSEGVPVTLMEAMAMERIVLAPDLTGIPELVISGRSGLLYKANSLDDFLVKLNLIRIASPSLSRLRRAAREHVQWNFNRERNLAESVRDFLRHIGVSAAEITTTYEDPVLQQVQLPVQRDRSVPV